MKDYRDDNSNATTDNDIIKDNIHIRCIIFLMNY